MDSGRSSSEIARRRLRGFLIHLMIYFAAVTVLLPVNLVFWPHSLWVLLPMVGWGAPLALHAAWAMGLFGSARK